MTVLLRNPAALIEWDQFGFFDDFDHYVTADRWTTVVSDSGAIAVADGVKGIISLDPSDGGVGDNDEAYLKSTTEIFKFVNGKPLILEAYIQYSEANTNDANVAFGVTDAVAGDLILDNGAGMKTSGSMLAIYKVDGGTVWKCVSSVSSSQTISTSVTTAGGASYQKLRIEWKPLTSTLSEAHFFVDDVPLKDSNNIAIVHRFDYSTTPTDMQVFLGVKNGDTNQETLLCDYCAAYQKR